MARRTDIRSFNHGWLGGRGYPDLCDMPINSLSHYDILLARVLMLEYNYLRLVNIIY